MAFLASLAGPLLSGLFNHNSASEVATQGDLSNMEASLQGDANASILTQTALSHKSTQYAQAIWTADEHVREASLYSEFTLGVQGSETNIIKKSMQMVDQASQNG